MLKSLIPAFILLFLITGCQKETIDVHSSSEKVENPKEIPELKSIKISNVHKINDLSNFFNKLESNNSKGPNNIEIIGEEANFISYAGNEYYTFQVKNDETSNLIENLVIHKDKKNNYQAYITVYDLSLSDKVAIEKGEPVELTDKVRYYPIDFNGAGELVNLQNKIATCYKFVEVEEVSRATGWEITVLALKEVPCPGAGDDGGGSDDGNDSGDGGSGGFDGGGFDGGGGGGNPGGPSPHDPPGADHETVDGSDIITAPMMRLDAIGSIKQILDLENSTPEMQWLMDDSSIDQVVDIFNFLKKEEESVDAKTYTKTLIQALSTNNYSNFFSLDIFTLDPYGVWKNLSQEEKNLAIDFPYDAYAIYENRPIAESMTTQKFGRNGLNDKSDSFRHAFFNALNTYAVGGYTAELFSTAHESEVPVELMLEKQMDIFNNSVGEDANINYPNLSTNALANKIYEELLNGNLMYLNPLDFTLSPRYDANRDGIQDCSSCLNGIISTTQLTPTN